MLSTLTAIGTERRALSAGHGPQETLETISRCPGLTLMQLQAELLGRFVPRSVAMKRLRGYVERCVRSGLIQVILGNDGVARYHVAEDLSWLGQRREHPLTIPAPRVTLPKFTVISLFSGAMGLDLGLQSSGRFRLLACIEKERAFCETIRLNKEHGGLSNDLRILNADIADVDPVKLLADSGLKAGEVDLIAGGPPCQPFSTARQRRTIEDTRGMLLWQFLRFVQVIQPKFFLLENVPGLLSAAMKHRPKSLRPENGGASLEPDEQPGTLVHAFERDLNRRCGGAYRVDSFEVDAVSYGAPQFRKRAILIGNRCAARVAFPDATHGPVNEQRETSSPFAALFPALKPWVTLREAIGDLHDPEPLILDFSPRKKRYLSHVPPGSNWRSLPVAMQRESVGKAWTTKGARSGWWRRLSFDEPSPTLVAMPCHASTSLCHPTETRALSLREYARIQEFPDEWTFHGTKAQQYAQIGNAVPVRLGRVAGEVIAEALDRVGAGS